MSPTQKIEHAIALYAYQLEQEANQPSYVATLAEIISIDVVWGWVNAREAWFDNVGDPILVQVALKVESGFPRDLSYFNHEGMLPYDSLTNAVEQWEHESSNRKAAIFNYPTSEHLRMEIARRGLFISIQDNRIAEAYDKIAARKEDT